jgi:hypothetical protein
MSDHAFARQLTSDGFEIMQVQNQYGIALDTHDWLWFRELFTDDVVADYQTVGQWNNVWTGLESWAQEFEAMHAEDFAATQHRMSTHVADVQGDAAWAMCYGDVTLSRHEEPERTISVLGYYDDDLVRTQKGWQISHRRFREILRRIEEPISENTPLLPMRPAVQEGAVEFLLHRRHIDQPH